MNSLSLAHLYGQCGGCMDREKLGCGEDRRGVKYCNLCPIDFQWRDGENKCYSVCSLNMAGNPPLRKRRGERERVILSSSPFTL